MEFSHSPRWSCNFVDVSGALTAHGYLITNKMHSPIFYVPNATGGQGFEGELYGTEPGEPTRKITGQNFYPPEDLGNQMFITQYRAGGDSATRWDMFAYSPSLRRVRRQPQPRRGDKLAEGAESFDDIFGRDPWEFSWKLIGADTLYQTVRFPNTRPVVTLGKSDGTLHDVATDQIKMMGMTTSFIPKRVALIVGCLKPQSKKTGCPTIMHRKSFIGWINTIFILYGWNSTDETGISFLLKPA